MGLVEPELLQGIRYRCIGPSRGGRVVAVAADPVRRSLFYFGAVAGGVWRSDDAGQYWQNISDGWFDTASIGALAVAPSDGNVIYAGTGEATIRIDVTHGNGVYRSTDGGRTWSHRGLEESRHIGAIAVHPTDPDRLWVAALGHASKDNPERGVYRSSDGGHSWERVLHVSDRAGAVDLCLDPTNPRILYASIWQARRTFWSIDSGGPDCGLWRSLDGGDTWTDLSRNEGLPDGTLGKIGVAASPARPGRVWAVVEAEGRKRGLYRSEDAGDSWEKVSSDPELTWRPWYYQHVVAHPTDADTVYVLNRDAWVSIDGGRNFEHFHTPHGDNHALWIDPTDPDRMIGSDDGGAWVSLNGGASWSTIYNQLTAQHYHVATDDRYPYTVYGTQQDNSSIAVPSRTGKGAINWGDCYPPGTAESGYVAPKPGDPDIVYVGAIGSSPGGGDALQRYDHRTRQVQLVSVWPEQSDDGLSSEYRFQWTYPIVFSPHDPDVLYACGNRVFRSVDEGMSWEAISPDLTVADPETLRPSGPLTMDTAGAEMYATIFSFLASAHRRGAMMAGSDDGLVHRTVDDGATWTDVTPAGLPTFSQVTMLAESPHAEGTVFMTVARHKMGDYAPHVFRTDDFGDTWTSITEGLPADDFCRVIREDPNRPGLLYLGTELGLYASFDGGGHWQSLQANLPVCPVYDLVVKDTDLVVATHGRSFWILDDLTQLHQVHEGLSESAAHLFAPRDTVRTPPDLFAGVWGDPGGKNYHVTLGQNATFLVDEEKTGHQVHTMLDAGTDAERGVRVSWWLRDEPEGEIVLAVLDGDGNEIDSFSSVIPEDKADRHGLYITTRAGINTFLWPMRHADGPRMTGSDFHKPPKGPLAVPGPYQVRLTVGDVTMTQPFNLLPDPRVETGADDFAQQFDLQSRIFDKLVAIVEAVNGIRALTRRLDDLAGRLRAADGDGAGGPVADIRALVERLGAIEGALVQAELTSPGDTLAHRSMLFEKLAALPPVVGSADTRPTRQSWQVYEKLAGQIDEQLAALQALHDTDLVDLNQRLGESGVAIVEA